MASAAARLRISGAGKSGNPCARLTAPCCTARRVISRMTLSAMLWVRLARKRGRIKIWNRTGLGVWPEHRGKRAGPRAPLLKFDSALNRFELLRVEPGHLRQIGELREFAVIGAVFHNRVCLARRHAEIIGQL